MMTRLLLIVIIVLMKSTMLNGNYRSRAKPDWWSIGGSVKTILTKEEYKEFAVNVDRLKQYEDLIYLMQ